MPFEQNSFHLFDPCGERYRLFARRPGKEMLDPSVGAGGAIKIFLLLSVVLFLPLSVLDAQGFQAGVWQAYGLVNMTDLNRYIVDSFNNLEASYGMTDGSLSEITTASIVGLDAGYEFYPGLVIGARIGQMRVSEGRLAGTINNNPSTGQTGPFVITFNSSLVPYMVGGQLRLGQGTRFSFSGAVYFGYAVSTADFNYSDSLGAFGIGSNVPLQGSGVCDDVSGELRYRISANVALGASLHLMTARISSVSPASDIPEANLSSGELFRDQRNSVLVLDYSNVAAALGLYFSF